MRLTQLVTVAFLTAFCAPSFAATSLRAQGGQCLDVRDGSTANGATVQIYRCTQGNSNQAWSFEGGALKNANGKCLDVRDGVVANGRALQMFDCYPGSQNQQWQLTGGAIRHTGSGFCVDITGGIFADGTVAQLWQCYDGAPNQAFAATQGQGAAAQGQAQSPAAGSSAGYLQTQGTRIVDPSGRTVMLRGTNIGGWLVTEGWMNGYTDASDKDPYRFTLETLERRFGEDKASELINTWRDRFFTAQDLDFIASIGLNVIRVPFGYRNLQHPDGSWLKGQDGHIDFDRLDWVVAEAAKRKIYTILDFHIWQGQQQDYSAISANSDAGRDAQAKAAAIWNQVAKHFKGNPWVAGFDAINEPTGSYANSMQDALYRAIRAVDQDRIIFMESMSADPASMHWSQVAYSIHQYDMMGTNFGANQAAFWKRFNSDVASFNRFNIPTYIGEFMVQEQGDTLSWLLQQYKDQKLHWTNWTYKSVNMGAWGLCNLPGDLHVDVLHDSFGQIKSTWGRIGACAPEAAVVSAFKNSLR